jgi:hypothetical protein
VKTEIGRLLLPIFHFPILIFEKIPEDLPLQKQSHRLDPEVLKVGGIYKKIGFFHKPNF